MKRLVIVGATGMVGGNALRIALSRPDVLSVTSIGRRSVGISNPKLREVIHPDFADCLSLAHSLAEQDAVVFCLGTYTGAVSNDELRRITVDYTAEFARVLYTVSPGVAFCFLSGMGADPTGKSRVPFSRYKGEAENLLAAENFGCLRIFRPAYIYPVKPRIEPTVSYRLLRWIYPAFRLMFPNLEVRSDELAQAMVSVALSDSGGAKVIIYENKDIKGLCHVGKGAT